MKRIIAAVPLVTLMVLLAGAAANAQGPDESLSVRVPFAFKIGDKTMAPGSYEVVLSRATKEVVFRPTGSKKVPEQMTQVKILTRLGSVGEKQTLIFDHKTDGNLLSEVWFKGDGYLLQGDASDLNHEHRKVKAAAVAAASVK